MPISTSNQPNKVNRLSKTPHLTQSKDKKSVVNVAIVADIVETETSLVVSEPAFNPPAKHSTKPLSPRQQQIIGLLSQTNGCTLADIEQVTHWQTHSIRGFISGVLRKQLRLAVYSEKREGIRFYGLDLKVDEQDSNLNQLPKAEDGDAKA